MNHVLADFNELFGNPIMVHYLNGKFSTKISAETLLSVKYYPDFTEYYVYVKSKFAKVLIINIKIVKSGPIISANFDNQSLVVNDKIINYIKSNLLRLCSLPIEHKSILEYSFIMNKLHQLANEDHKYLNCCPN